MDNKKKLNISLNKYGMRLKMVLLFMLVLSLQIIFCPTSYAYVSSDYFNDTVLKFSSYARPTNYSYYGNLYQNVFSNLSSSDKTYVLNNINTFLDNNNISNLNDYNCIFSLNPYARGECYLKVIFCNNSSPNGYEDIAFFNVGPSAIGFKPSTDKMYQISFVLGSTPSIYYQGLVSSHSIIDTYNLSYDTSSTILTCPNINCCGIPLGYYNQTDGTCILENPYGNYTPLVEPDEPSGESSGDSPSGSGLGDIVNPSGDNAGSINLAPIQQGITDIQNQISGDTQKVIDNQNQNTQTIVNSISGEVNKVTSVLTDNADSTIDNTYITSGDIYNSLGITPIENPYTNLWTNLLSGFENALTSENRTFSVEFRGHYYTITVDMITSSIPVAIKTFLGILSTVYVVIAISKWTKIIIDDISTASIDNVANKLTEDFVTNMF